MIKLPPKFWPVFVALTLYFIAVGFASFYFFGAGIYSCRDAFAGSSIPPQNLEFEIQDCREGQAMGNVILLLHFGLPIVAGALLGQWVWFWTGTDANWPIGTVTFLIGFLSVLLFQVTFLAWLVAYFATPHRD